MTRHGAAVDPRQLEFAPLPKEANVYHQGVRAPSPEPAPQAPPTTSRRPRVVAKGSTHVRTDPGGEAPALCAAIELPQGTLVARFGFPELVSADTPSSEDQTGNPVGATVYLQHPNDVRAMKCVDRAPPLHTCEST